MKNCSILILAHLSWLSLFMSSFGVCREIVCIPNERETLLKLKHHLKDHSNRLSSWNATIDSNCCNWVGVVCSNITAHVVELHLNISVPSFYREDVFDEKAYEDYSGSVFGGEINPCLIDLKHLNYLDFSGNYVGGRPFPSFVATMTTLTHLNLSDAGFVGNIPPDIGNLSNLLYLELGSNNLFTENIDWISSLSKLRYLDLSRMRLLTRGMPLPTHLGTMTSLTHLDLSDVAFSGNIPSQIGNLSNLLYLDLNSYSIFPEDLDWLSNLSKLEYLGLRGTNLSQSFHWLHNIQALPSLMHLSLERCAFPHNNPPSLFNFSSLLILDISACTVSFLPKWIFGFKKLVSLSLSFNNFEDPIPDSIRNLTLLVNLDLSENSFSSSIPNGLYSLHYLKFLDLGCNNLHGTISDVENLTSLIKLDFHDNSIGGALPESFEKLSSLRYLDLSNNQFNGNPFEILGSLSNLVNLFIEDNCFKGIVTEDNLANLTMLQQIMASGNTLTLKVGPDWYPTFQLTRLHLDSWQLGPNFPSWIESQNRLHYLRMSNTGILDSIPNWFWERFSQASYLNLSHNHIHGELGSTIKNPISIHTVDLSTNHLRGKLPYLSNDVYGLDLSSNSLSGSMDDFLCRNQDKPMALEFLNLASNNLSGDLPNCWKIWPFLAELYLQNNHFVGNLPPSMGSLAVLQSFQIHKNLLSGIFPTSLKKNNQLKVLDLGANNLSGTIPQWVGEKLLNLKILVLRSNNFSGHIPNEICDMSLLQIIDLAGNHLSGNIPTCFNNLSVMTLKNRSTNPAIYSETPYTIYYTTVLNMVSELLWLKGTEGEYKSILGLVTSIDLSRNKLSGEIPREITDLDGLLYLNLSRNQFSGQIPPSICNMRWLESLDISRNRLSGEIPSTISNLNFLNRLDLSHNHFKGKIPRGIQIQSFEASNFVGNNLCGPPLPINCSSNQQIPYIDSSETKNGGHGVNWFFVSMTLGFIVGFWVAVVPLFISRSWRYTYFCFLDDMWYKLQSYW